MLRASIEALFAYLLYMNRNNARGDIFYTNPRLSNDGLTKFKEDSKFGQVYLGNIKDFR